MMLFARDCSILSVDFALTFLIQDQPLENAIVFAFSDIKATLNKHMCIFFCLHVIIDEYQNIKKQVYLIFILILRLIYNFEFDNVITILNFILIFPILSNITYKLARFIYLKFLKYNFQLGH